MIRSDIGRVVSLVGLAVQAASAVLLAVLFLLLIRAGERRSYFKAWTGAWLALALALACVGAFFLEPPASAHVWLLAGYQAGKCAFFGLLFSGAWRFTRAGRPALPPPGSIAVVAAFTGASLLITRDVASLMALQALVAIPFLIAATVALVSEPPARRSFGLWATAISLISLSVLWMLYLTLHSVPPSDSSLLGTMRGVLSPYNSYVDLLLQTVLAFGMVLMASEEAHRELAIAHGALNIAHEQLRGEAQLDPLTGALNRRAYSELRPTDPVLTSGGCVVVVDFDDFKGVNDRHGHATGDAMLKHFVQQLGERLRDTDLLYRLGGDEFLVIVPGATPDRLEPRFGEILGMVPPLSVDGAGAVPVATSWGLDAFADADDLGRAVREADRRMYASKHGVAATPAVLPAEN